MADGAVGYAGHIVTRGYGVLRRAVGVLLAENYVERDRAHVIRPEHRPPEAMEPGPLAGPDAEPENAHRLNGAAAAAAAAAPGVPDATAEAAARAAMVTRSRYAFVLFLGLSFFAGFGVGMCWGAAAATPVSGDIRAIPPAEAPMFRVTFNVEGHTADDMKFRLNMVSDPVKSPSQGWPGWGVLRSASEHAASTARSVSARAVFPARLAYSFLVGMATNSGDSAGSSSSSSGNGGGGGSGGGEWPGWEFLRSVSEQAAITARQAFSLLDWMSISNGDDDTGSSSSGNRKSGPNTRTHEDKWANPFKAFTSWREKHRDDAEKFMNGPLV